jgi:aspartate/methionine/tyrosine aminotransferase
VARPAETNSGKEEGNLGGREEVSDRLSPFGTTIFAEMTALAAQHDAVNLSQGFPDFDGPEAVKDAAIEAIRSGSNQYARTTGLPELNLAIAQAWGGATGFEIDPDREVTVTSGCTEALASSFLGLVNPGDEVVLFEPYYDSYMADCAISGAVARPVTLRPVDGEFLFEEEELRAAFSARTRAVLLNTPHNPTGKVFSRAELDLIAALCVEHDAIAITDEVYERLVYDPALPHIRLATLPGMRERTLTLSSLGKTFSLTGWKVGWAIGPAELTAGVRAAHQFLTFATPGPMQIGAAAALLAGEGYVEELVEHYRGARDYLCDALEHIGFGVMRPAGTYFVMADHARFGFEDDVALCRHLATDIGVAAIPPSVFYAHPERGRSLVRFAFCKRMETLERAVERLGNLRPL